MKKLLIAVSLIGCSFFANADLEALPGGGISYSQDSSAGHLSTDDLAAINQDKKEQLAQEGKRYCVKYVWQKAGEAYARLQLGQEIYPSQQYQDDKILTTEKQRNYLILGCIEDYKNGKVDKF